MKENSQKEAYASTKYTWVYSSEKSNLLLTRLQGEKEPICMRFYNAKK